VKRARRTAARRSPLPWLAAGALAVAAIGVGLAARPRDRVAGGGPRPNVLLVTIDTLRADHLGCYGYAAAATPALDALAARGARFPVAVAHAPLTAPSHASILTGLTPLRHGVRDNGRFVLPETVPTAAEAFRASGYRTAAFVSGFPLHHRFGLGRGFDTYDDRLPYGDDPRRAAHVERRAGETTAAARAWLERAGGESPWFVWVHYFDPHAPYEPPAEMLPRFADRPYDGEIAFVDAQLGTLLSWLETNALAARTIVLATADHGESLGEHGEDTHGLFVYDATLRVPWILAGPRIPGGRTPGVVARGIDVAPTLLDLARVPPRAAMEGRSLRPALEGAVMSDAPVYAESLFASLNLGWAPLHAWRTARYKWIEAPRPEMYDLAHDPAETADRSAAEADAARALRQALQAALAVRPPEAMAAASREETERLRALGYIAGAAPVQPSGRDPKDGIALVNRLERGLAEARANPALARRELSAALADDPKMTLARRYRAIAAASASDYPAAVADLKALDAEGAATPDDLVLLAECLRGGDRLAEALATAERAERLQPASAEPTLTRARILLAQGRTAEAGAAYDGLLRRSPAEPEAVRGLADLALRRGDLEEAARRYGRILEDDPQDAGALVRLGVVQIRAGRNEEALALFRRAVELQPDNAEALTDLAAALAKAGRPAEAIPYFERAVAAGARTTAVLNGLGFARLEAGDDKGALAALSASLALDRKQPGVAEAARRLSGR
jgi:arylsulfatase A-like enzyme/Flp pilus assembly protein TadD